jgi:hypothetical protein
MHGSFPSNPGRRLLENLLGGLNGLFPENMNDLPREQDKTYSKDFIPRDKIVSEKAYLEKQGFDTPGKQVYARFHAP